MKGASDKSLPAIIVRLPGVLAEWVRPNWRQFGEERQALVWVLALVVGAGAGVLAVLFREAIALVQWLWLGSGHENLVQALAGQPAWRILAGPVVAGGVVALLLPAIRARRTGGVPDVIEARTAARPSLSKGDGAWSAVIAAVSLGGGLSAGREGPVVHLGATLATAVAGRASLPVWSRRTLLAAGTASAVAASFNAPIAGVLFAHEVILDHYSRRAFVPIVLASAVGSVIARLWFGDAAAFAVPPLEVVSLLEFPAFALLGLAAAFVAVLFQFTLYATDFAARASPVPPRWLPVAGGVLVGLIGLAFPHVLGVGYGTTDLALRGGLPLAMLLVLIAAKTLATAITLACRFGGGIFSPALYLGALTGSAFGMVAGAVFPELASSPGLYAVLGMGAVAGAVLGAPVSTTLIVFELTGGFELSVALLLSVAVAHGVTRAVHGHSWFEWQLEMRGLAIAAGPGRVVAATIRVRDFMEPAGADPPSPEALAGALHPLDTLDAALRRFDETGRARLPVVDPSGGAVLGEAGQLRALAHFNRALLSASEEEHR